jgi:hypothetical protein
MNDLTERKKIDFEVDLMNEPQIDFEDGRVYQRKRNSPEAEQC